MSASSFDLGQGLLLFELEEDRVDLLVGLHDLLSAFGAGKHDFAAREDQKDNFRALHFVDESREEFGFVMTAAKAFLSLLQSLQLDAKSDVTAGHDILYRERAQTDSELERSALHWPEFLGLTLIWPAVKHLLDCFFKDFACLHGAHFRFGSRDHHLAFRENERRSFWLSYAHHYCRKATWVILGVATPHGDFPQVKFLAVEVGCRH